jgi:hypothetical protein
LVVVGASFNALLFAIMSGWLWRRRQGGQWYVGRVTRWTTFRHWLPLLLLSLLLLSLLLTAAVVVTAAVLVDRVRVVVICGCVDGGGVSSGR